MEEKFKKALKTLKQGIWILLILSLVMNLFSIVTLSKEGENVFLNYIKENVFSLIQTVALITGLMFFAKGKYKTGAQVTQWSGMASIIISFATVITTYIIMGNLGVSILSIVLPYILTGLIIPIILIVDSLKVLRLAETDEQQKNIVPVLAIIVIVTVIAFNTITIIETKNTIEDLKEQIQNTILDTGIQSIDKTESIDNESKDKIEENKQEDYAEIMDRIENAVTETTFSDANSYLSIKYAEILSEHYNNNPGKEYKVNSDDLKILQQHIIKRSEGKYTVRINKNAYEVVQHNIENIQETNKPEDKIDPYANYKDVKWCGQKDELIEIKNGKVLITYDGSRSYSLTNDKPISVARTHMIGGVSDFFVLGESGKVYKVDEEDNIKLVEVKELSNNIIAMTTQKTGVNYRPIYFLTSNGELIDFKGCTYEENNEDLTGTYGRFCPMYFNTAGNVYYINRNNEKIYIKDKQSKNIVAKTVFWQSISLDETYTILTTNDQLVYFTYDGDYNISYNNQKIKSYKIQEVNDENNNSQFNVVFSMEDNTNVTITDINNNYYDVTTGEFVEIITGQDVLDN